MYTRNLFHTACVFLFQFLFLGFVWTQAPVDFDFEFTVSPDSACDGQTATFNYSIINTGSSALQLSVEDDLFGIVSGARVTDGLQALYTFSEGSGTTIRDVSGIGNPIDLEIEDPGNVTWSTHSISVNSSTRAINVNPAGNKINDACQLSNELTIEGWVKPANNSQSGPSRFIGYTYDSGNWNFHLNQTKKKYGARLRTTGNNTNGLNSTGNIIASTPLWSHVVYTFDGSSAKLYVDGVQVSTSGASSPSGNLSNWQGNYAVCLWNEYLSTRAWLGEMGLAAIYSKALSAAEISQNHDAGYQNMQDLLQPGDTLVISNTYNPQLNEGPVLAVNAEVIATEVGGVSLTKTASVALAISDCTVPEDCNNGIDDNGDGLIDCNDPSCDCYVGDEWSYDCQDNTCVEIFGRGIKNLSTETISVPNSSSIKSVVLEATFSGGPDQVTFTSSNGETYTVDKIYFPGHSGTNGDRYFTCQMHGADSYTVTHSGAANKGESFLIYVFSECENVGSYGKFIHRSFYNNTETFGFAIPATNGPKDVEILVPLSEMTNDGRIANVYASAGGMTASITVDNYNVGNSLNMTPFIIEDVPDTATYVEIIVESPAGGQSLYLSGAASVRIECAAELTVIKSADMTYASAGDTINFTFDIYNYGTTALNNCTAIDENVGALTLPSTTMAAGQSFSITEPYIVQPGDLPGPIDGTVIATGIDAVSLETKTDSSETSVPLIDLDFAFTAAPSSVCNGETITFDYTITNTGSAPLQLDLEDDLFGEISDKRIKDGLQALYTFSEGSGTTIYDVSGIGDAIDLEIQDPGNVTWNANTISVNSSTRAINVDPSGNKINDACQLSNELTIEGWVKPANNSQGGPSRFIGYTYDSGNWNFHLNQSGNDYGARLRTTGNNTNGLNSTGSIIASTPQWSHVVYTFDGSSAKLYVDGVEVGTSGTSSPSGNFSNWQGDYAVCLWNEYLATRAWLGDMGLAAIYSKALSAAEISQNYDAGYVDVQGLLQPGETIVFSNEYTPQLSDGPILTVNATVNATANGQGVIVKTEQVNIGVGTSPALSVSSATTICAGASATISANTPDSGTMTYVWDNGLGSGAAKTVTPASTTTYSVTVTNEAGCTESGTVTITANASPTADAGADVPICNGGTTTLNASASGGTTPYVYTWSNGLGNGDTHSIDPSATETYVVTVSSPNGCSDTDEITVSVISCVEDCTNGIDDDLDGLVDCDDPDCGPSITMSSDTTICAGYTITISANAVGGTNYTWNEGLGTGTEKTVRPFVTTTYSVSVSSANGCVSVAQITVTVENCFEICDNGLDDDNDGLVDCDDPDCALNMAAQLQDDTFTGCPGIPLVDYVIFNDYNYLDPIFSIAAQPANGIASIDDIGKITYIPLTVDCLSDVFEYEVFNQQTGCSNTAQVTINLGDTTPPTLNGVPADLTISCNDQVPDPPHVFGFDSCPGIYVDFDETTSAYDPGGCITYTITRTWTATDLCGNVGQASQIITVMDMTPPEIFRVYTLKNDKKLLGGVAQNVSHLWKYVSFPLAFESTPVIFAQVTSANESGAVIVQKRNISDQGFEMRLLEEEGSDGEHGFENVSWLAIETGAMAGMGEIEVGLLSDVTDAASSLNLNCDFTSTPAMFFSQQSSEEIDPALVHFENATVDGADVSLIEETTQDAETTHAEEQLGYMAMQPGITLTEENGFFVGESGQFNVTDDWTTVTLVHEFSKPVITLSRQSSNENEPALLRVQNVGENSFQVRLEEWSDQDGDHASETVAYLVVEGGLPATEAAFCSDEATTLVNGLTIFVKDNCDEFVTLDFDETSNILHLGLRLNRTWTASDDCDNELVISRSDTCSIAALRLKALLNGPYLHNGGTGLMNDNLRSGELLPMQEPYSELPGFYTMTHDSITFTSIEEMESSNMPAGTADAAYRTVMDGDWEDASIWESNQKPSLPSLNCVSISIEHQVSLPEGTVLTLEHGSQLYVSNGSLVFNGGGFIVEDASAMFVNSALDMDGGDIKLDDPQANLVLLNSTVNINEGDFLNIDGTRKLENVMLTVGENYTNSNGVDSLVDVHAVVQGNFENNGDGNIFIENSEFKVVNGNFKNASNCSLTGNEMMVLVQNGNFENDGNWTAYVSGHCVSGNVTVSQAYLMNGEDCTATAMAFENYGFDPNEEGAGDMFGGGIGMSENRMDTLYTTVNTGSIDGQMFEQTGENAVVDWVLIELRDPVEEGQIVGSVTGVILRDGTILSESGDSIIYFPRAWEGDYYITVRHRNHLGLMTNVPYYLASDAIEFIDFSNPSVEVRGGHLSARIVDGKRTMWAGDFNEDGKIVYQGPDNDIFQLFVRVYTDEDNVDGLANYISQGYDRHDLNLDGKVIYQGPNNERADLLYHTTLAHAGNWHRLANFIVEQGLP